MFGWQKQTAAHNTHNKADKLTAKPFSVAEFNMPSRSGVGAAHYCFQADISFYSSVKVESLNVIALKQ